MRNEAIETLAMLLNFLRSYEISREVRPTNFHFNGKEFSHFYDASDGLLADIFLSKGRRNQTHRKEKQVKVEQINPDKRVMALVMNGSLRGANRQIESENQQ